MLADRNPLRRRDDSRFVLAAVQDLAHARALVPLRGNRLPQQPREVQRVLRVLLLQRAEQRDQVPRRDLVEHKRLQRRGGHHLAPRARVPHELAAAHEALTRGRKRGARGGGARLLEEQRGTRGAAVELYA